MATFAIHYETYSFKNNFLPTLLIYGPGICIQWLYQA